MLWSHCVVALVTKSFRITLRVLPGYAKKCGVHVAPLMLHIPCKCQCTLVHLSHIIYYSRCDHLPNTGGYGTGRGHHHSAAFSRPEVAEVACGQILHGLISHWSWLRPALRTANHPMVAKNVSYAFVTKYAMP